MSLLGKAAMQCNSRISLSVDVKCFAFPKLWIVGSLFYYSNYARATLEYILKHNALSRSNKLFSLESNKISRYWFSLCIYIYLKTLLKECKRQKGKPNDYTSSLRKTKKNGTLLNIHYKCIAFIAIQNYTSHLKLLYSV